MVEVGDMFEAGSSRLSSLRTARDRMAASKRKNCKAEIYSLKDRCRNYWELVLKLDQKRAHRDPFPGTPLGPDTEGE